MSQPASVNWGSSNLSDSAYFATPSSTEIQRGWQAGTKPPNQYANYLQQNVYQWQQYLFNRQESNEPTVLNSSGTATWNGSALVLSSNLDISFRKSTGKQVNRIASGTLTFTNDGDCLVLRKDFDSSSPVTCSSGTYSNLTDGQYAIVAESTLAEDNEEFESVIFRRNGTNLECVYNGFIYPTGSTISFGVSASSSSSFSGVLDAAHGGTGQSSYAVGDLLYASGSTTLSKLADVATGNVLRAGGVGVAPSWGKADLTTDVTAILPIANGGTGGNTSTGSGALVLANSPTIVTPTIASFTNSNHNHQNSAGGGTLDTAAIASGTFADARIAASNITQHQASLSIAETQIPDGSLLARVGGNETITGSWLFPSTDPPATDAMTRHSILKAWVITDSVGTITDSFNIASVSHPGTGRYSIVWDRNFATNDHPTVVSTNVGAAPTPHVAAIYSSTTTPPDEISIEVRTYDASSTLDNSGIYLLSAGDQI